MSRLLLPLLRSRTAHSLRPLPDCRPRGSAGAPAPLLRPPPALAAAAPAWAAAPRPSRGLGTHPKREPMEALNTAQGARDFIYSLHSTERSCLLKELHRFESIAIAQGKGLEPRVGAARPPPLGPRLVFIHNALPFVGFGFLDNAIMIVAVSSFFSPPLLIYLAGYVEALASRLGLSIPDLTPKQVDMWQTRLSAHLGKAVGVTIGCILGMFPLLFFRGEEEEKKLEEKN
uniref:Transmembrane protein 65 n=1 Tax=Vombatus ursinus TaxID=29139 RepID=A0A4X2KTE7_VOMUR